MNLYILTKDISQLSRKTDKWQKKMQKIKKLL